MVVMMRYIFTMQNYIIKFIWRNNLQPNILLGSERFIPRLHLTLSIF